MKNLFNSSQKELAIRTRVIKRANPQTYFPTLNSEIGELSLDRPTDTPNAHFVQSVLNEQQMDRVILTFDR